MPSREPETRRRRRGYNEDYSSSSPTKRSPRKSLDRTYRRQNNRREPDSTDESSSEESPLPSRTTIPNATSGDGQRPTAINTKSRPSLPYPSFSKAHSREAVGLPDVHTTSSLLTPESTDLGKDAIQPTRPLSHPSIKHSTNSRAPPSPPLTVTDSNIRRDGSRRDVYTRNDGHGAALSRSSTDKIRSAEKGGPRVFASTGSLRKPDDRPKLTITPRNSSSPKPKKHRKYPSIPGVEGSSPLSRNIQSDELRTTSLPNVELSTISRTDSDTTSVAPTQTKFRRPPHLIPPTKHSPPSDTESSPQTPKEQKGTFLPDSSKPVSGLEIFTSNDSESDRSGPPHQAQNKNVPPPPPPPPPPPCVPSTKSPKIDYLLQNGGLPSLRTRSFVSANASRLPQTYEQYSSPQIGHTVKTADAMAVFDPFLKLLDDYSTVMAGDGSLAVATGYKSIARRLLDRLESVFSRKISSEICQCVMCQVSRRPNEENAGVSWGEILEMVSGRSELPHWPPFVLTSGAQDFSDLDRPAPMQKLDIDVPDEYRDHYIRQSKKTKQAVQNWLASQPEDQVSPPQEVDDETLTFAMLTYLEPQQRGVFTALIRGMNSIPSSRTPTPALVPQAPSPKSELMANVGQALQRLYRLSKPPRDPECTMFLLKNPSLHNVLATIAAVSSGEWETLVSGRFNSFLWGGAEETSASPITRVPVGSRSSTPATVTTPRLSTPFTRAPSATLPSNIRSTNTTPSPSLTPVPVQDDEDTELAVLAEVEREIYQGMEALEDAFEALHLKAQTVRSALRQRSAGLAMGARARLGGAGMEEPRVRGATPALNHGLFGGTEGVSLISTHLAGGAGLAWGVGGGGDMEHDDGLGAFDARSELAPDDSASNISGRRRRRRHGHGHSGAHGRRGERRTPAVVEEDERE